MRTDHNTTKLCTRLFFHKVIKIKTGAIFWPQHLLNLPTGVVGYFSIKPLLLTIVAKLSILDVFAVRCLWTYSIILSCLIQINKWGIALKLLLTQSKIMVWSFSAKDSWCTKRFSKLWVTTSRTLTFLVLWSCQKFLFGKCWLNCKKISVKMKAMYLNFDELTLSQLIFDGFWQ